MHRRIIGFAVIALGLACMSPAQQPAPGPAPAAAAAPPAPKSPSAIAAIKKYNAAVQKLEADYARQFDVVRRALVTELEKSKREAMTAGNLEEANRIVAAINSTAPRPASDPQKTPPRQIVGVWSLTYSNGVRRKYEIAEDGTVRWNTSEKNEASATSKSGRLQLRDGDLLLDTMDGKLERLNLVGDRLFIEHFYPAGDYERQKKWSVLALGQRAENF